MYSFNIFSFIFRLVSRLLCAAMPGGLLVAMGLVVAMIGCSGIPVQNDPMSTKSELVITVNGAECEAKGVSDEQAAIDMLNSSAMTKLSLSSLSFISNNRLNIYLFSGITVSDVKKIDEDIVKTEDNTGIRDARLFIDSPGGDAFSGLALADKITNARERGWTIEADAVGIVASAAVPIFASCSPRKAYPGTIFMVHEAALWKWPGRETSSDIRAQQELMVTLQDRYLAYLVNNSCVSHDEWVKKERATTWFTSDTAKDWCLVDELL